MELKYTQQELDEAINRELVYYSLGDLRRIVLRLSELTDSETILNEVRGCLNLEPMQVKPMSGGEIARHNPEMMTYPDNFISAKEQETRERL